MPGDVVPVADDMLATQVRQVAAALKTLKDTGKIIVPPIPRYMFGGCCNNSSHAQNTQNTTHGQTSLNDHTRQRKTIIQTLADSGCSNFKVLDFVGTYAPDHLPTTQKLDILRHHTHQDNVHLSPDGYAKLANRIIDEALSLTSKNNTNRKHTSTQRTLTGRSWRGFISTAGIGRSSAPAPAYSRHLQRHRHHPYKKQHTIIQLD